MGIRRPPSSVVSTVVRRRVRDVLRGMEPADGPKVDDVTEDSRDTTAIDGAASAAESTVEGAPAGESAPTPEAAPTREAAPTPETAPAAPTTPVATGGGAHAAERPGTLGIWAFVLAILGVIVLPIVGSVLGFVLGRVAIRQAQFRRLRGGRGLALAAVIISVVTLVIYAVSIAAYALVVAFVEI